MKLYIKTTYIGPTGTKGSRIKATFNGKSSTIPYDYSLNSHDLHFKAALAFANKHDLGVCYNDSVSHDRGYKFLIVEI